MGRHYRSYSYQFKKDLVDQIESGQISITDAAREHNLMRSLIRRWIDQFHKGSIVEKPTVREKALERELEHYKKKVGELTVANDLLKKTMESSRRRRRLNANLRDMIEKIQVRHPRCGYRPMKWYLLREEGMLVNHKKIRRIMNKYGLQAQIRRAFTVTTDSEHGYKVYPNLLAKETSTNIDQIWVADITYIRILTGFVYLAVIIDIYSRRVVGWALSKKIDSELTVSALKDAIEKRKPSAGGGVLMGI